MVHAGTTQEREWKPFDTHLNTATGEYYERKTQQKKRDVLVTFSLTFTPLYRLNFITSSFKYSQ